MAQDAAAAPAYLRAAEPQVAVAPPKAKRSPRRFLLPLIVIGAAAFGAHWGYGYFTEGRFIVSTDDAYVGANIVIVAPKVAGYITDVRITNNEEVKAGDLLAEIDAGDYDLAVTAAKDKLATQSATITRFDRQIEAQRALVTQSKAQIEAAAAAAASAAADEQRAALEFDRAQKLAQTSFGSQQRLEQANADRKRTAAASAGARASLASAKAQLAWVEANVGVLQSQKDEAVHTSAELQTAVDRALRDLSFTEIRAPFDGMIGNKAIEVGQYVQPGTRLLAVVPLDKVYVDANFKETQLADLKPGQRVDVAVDAFDGRKVSCVVDSVAPASGAEFSLLPPDNATGNFTKIVQRITVRIGCDAEALKNHALRPGLSVVVSVHTRDESLPKPSLISALGLEQAAHRLEGLRPAILGALGLDKGRR